MARVSLTVRVDPCGHYLHIEPRVELTMIAFPSPRICPTCGHEVYGFRKIIRADTHEEQLVMPDDLEL